MGAGAVPDEILANSFHIKLAALCFLDVRYVTIFQSNKIGQVNFMGYISEYMPSGCAISGILNKKGRRFTGERIMKSIALMRERSNGLGGGFAAYGIYPEFKDHYALHLIYSSDKGRADTEQFLQVNFIVDESGPIPTRPTRAIENSPLVWRYFVRVKPGKLEQKGRLPDAEDFIVSTVMEINEKIPGAFVMSSGKNMGVFKGVGYPEDIGEFYRLDEYKGYIWTAHGRFPTNTPGWWGGAHPFTLLNWSVVHNGEISSYGANMRCLKMFGYQCSLQTDTEAITYIFDLLVRRQGLSLETAVKVVAAPLWCEIERMDPDQRELLTAIRAVYGSLLVNGPFSIILATSEGMLALNDRIKLRPMTAAEKGDELYVASEEAAIREVCPYPDRVWMPDGGEAIIGKLDEPVKVVKPRLIRAAEPAKSGRLAGTVECMESVGSTTSAGLAK